MAARKRIRPRRSAGGAQREAAQQAKAAERRRAEEARAMAGFMTMAEAAAVTGTSRFRMSRLIKREGITTYELPADRRQKLVKESDLERLTTPRPRGSEASDEPAQDGAGDGAQE